MTYEEFAADVARASTFSFNSVEENEETMRRLGVEQVMRQLGRGSYRSDLAVTRSDPADLYCDRFGKATAMTLAAPTGFVGLLAITSVGGPVLACGREVANGKLVLMPVGETADIVGPDLLGSESLAVPAKRFAQLLDALYPGMAAAESVTVIEGDTERLRALRRRVTSRVTGHGPGNAAEDIAGLLAAFVKWLADASHAGRSERLSVSARRAGIARRAREFIEDHHHEVFQLDAVCRHCGVGIRTLQRSFWEYFDTSVGEYLKAVRLNAAHRDLAGGDHEENSVTEIALRHGWPQLGRFGAEYRRLFGE